MLYKQGYKRALQFPLRFWLFCSIRIVFEVIRDEKLTCPVGQQKVILIMLMLSDFRVLLVPDNRTSVTVEACIWFGSMILMQVWKEMRQNKSVGLYTSSLTLKELVTLTFFSAFFNTAHYYSFSPINTLSHYFTGNT